MTLSVRISLCIERKLADYCAKNRVSKSEAVRIALDQFLSANAVEKSPYELAKDLIAPEQDERPLEDVAINSKRLLRERSRSTVFTG